MRIVAVADTHLYQDDLEVPPGDLFVHAGDLLRGGSLDELQSAAAWLQALPHPHKVVVAGNHDRCLQDDPARARAILGPDIHYLQDTALELLGLSIWGSPWQPAYNGWAFNLPRGQALRERWDRIPAGLDLLITHSPPQGRGDRSPVDGRHGCADLAVRVGIVRPRVHVFGHIHQDGGFWDLNGTAFINATTWECERQPTVFDLFPDGRVVPVTVPPAETPLV